MNKAKHRTWYSRITAGRDGMDFVPCRICGEHRRVISGQHLSKHDIDRESYIGGISPQPGRTYREGFSPHKQLTLGLSPFFGKSDWIVAVKLVKPFDALIVGCYEGDKLNFVAKVRNGFVPHVRREVYHGAHKQGTAPASNDEERSD